MTTPEQLAQAAVPQWFANRGPVPASLNLNEAVFSLVLPKLKIILDAATLRLRNATSNNRTEVGNVVRIIGDVIRDGYNTFVVQYEKQHEPLDPAATKAAILLMIDDFYSKVVAPLDIPFVPNILENTFVDPAIGKIVHEIASAMYDVIVKALDSIPMRMLGETGAVATPAVYSSPSHNAEAQQTGRLLAPNPTEAENRAALVSDLTSHIREESPNQPLTDEPDPTLGQGN